jgi:hypothetical protein
MSTPEQLASPNPATTNWVPIWNLNPTGVDLRYLGDYVAGSYSDGDVVVYQGVLYECVRPTTNPPTPWAGNPGGIAYGTTLPGSAYDGQEAVLVDSVTAPTYQWRFRYNGQSTLAYKWEFVGGAPKVLTPGNYTPAAITTWYTDTAAGSVITAPRAGDYFAQAVTNIASGAGVGAFYMGFPQVVPRAGQYWGGSGEVSISFMASLPGLTAGAQIVNQFYCSNFVATFNNRYLSAIPLRVA